MKSILAQLQSDEAVLLMYLADELPQEDAAEVRRRLERDDALRTQLEVLRAAVQCVDRHMADAGPVDDIAAARAIRQTTSALRKRSAEQRQVQTSVPEPQRWRLPAWGYAAAAAAVLLVAVSVYLANMRPPEQWVFEKPESDPSMADPVAGMTVERSETDPLEAADRADDLAATFDDSDWVVAEAIDGGGLGGAMKQLSEIQRLSGETAGIGTLQ